MSNHRVQDALLAMTPSGAPAETDTALAPPSGGLALALELEALAQEIASTPGAGGALLATFAEQARVLQLVAQAAERSPHAPLPPEVRHAVEAAVHASAGSEPGSSAAPYHRADYP